MENLDETLKESDKEELKKVREILSYCWKYEVDQHTKDKLEEAIDIMDRIQGVIE